MPRAMDSASQFVARRLPSALGLSILSVLATIGCTQMEPARPTWRPTSLLNFRSRNSSAEPPPASTPRNDVYARVMERGRAQSEAALAKAAKEAEEAERAFAARSNPTPDQIALQPPIEADEEFHPARTPAAAPVLTEVPPDGPSGPELTPPTAPAAAPREIQAIVEEARAALGRLSTYQVRLNRQERLGQVLQPAEEVLLSIRRDPKAVRIEWPEGPHKGREVIYSATDDPNVMHVNMADSAIPLPPMRLNLESRQVKASSRHPISEAGLDTIVEQLADDLKELGAGNTTLGQLSYEPEATAEGLDRPCRKVTRVTPGGETRVVYFDPQTNLPTLVQVTAANGDLLERYLFHDLKPNVAELASADAFDPARRWANAPRGGLLQRLARSNGTAESASASSTAR
ncbi:MAG: DUF1571 domain-containing protein [Isosphaeraceae bacterium]|nr:DUF1571 domain-containing protein [Isosphaeraceae bacterium]